MLYEAEKSERERLDTARREAEDNLVKTVVQLSTALIVVLAGFITASDLQLTDNTAFVVSFSAICFGLAILFGLAEHGLSAVAHSQQITNLQSFYQRKATSMPVPRANPWVRVAQAGMLLPFLAGMGALVMVTVTQAGENSRAKQSAKTSEAKPTSSPAAKPSTNVSAEPGSIPAIGSGTGIPTKPGSSPATNLGTGTSPKPNA